MTSKSSAGSIFVEKCAVRGIALVFVTLCCITICVLIVAAQLSSVSVPTLRANFKSPKHNHVSYYARACSGAQQNKTVMSGTSCHDNDTTQHRAGLERLVAVARQPHLNENTRYFHSNISAFITSQRYDILDLLSQPGESMSPPNLYSRIPAASKIFTVLPWTTRWGRPWYRGTGAYYFAACPFSNCQITNDRTMADKADAVLVHMRSITSGFQFPSERTPNQYWISVTREPPYSDGKLNFSSFNGEFNATATYLTSSEIFFTNGYVVKRQHPLMMTDINKIDVRRPKIAAWFVSHCKVQSRRIQFTKRLQEYIPVDVYGKCGSLVCKGIRKCYAMLEKSYKFYLSFENSICSDYVTEKV